MANQRPAAAEEARVRELYDQAVASFGPALQRLTQAYEADPERRQDVLQEVHLAIWQSLSRFDGRCALGTWVYRVAHNTATSVCIRRRRNAPQLVSIEDLDVPGPAPERERAVDDGRALDRIFQLIHRLRPLDRQVMLLYLEGMDANTTGEVVGLSSSNVATKLHRLKKVLAQQFMEGGLV